MNNELALSMLKKLVKQNRFEIVNRRAQHAQPISLAIARIVVAQLKLTDFVKKEKDRDRPTEYIWVYQTDVGIIYYLKFKFSSTYDWVRFISFHESLHGGVK